jgi:hypothetical protein
MNMAELEIDKQLPDIRRMIKHQIAVNSGKKK